MRFCFWGLFRVANKPETNLVSALDSPAIKNPEPKSFDDIITMLQKWPGITTPGLINSYARKKDIKSFCSLIYFSFEKLLLEQHSLGNKFSHDRVTKITLSILYQRDKNFHPFVSSKYLGIRLNRLSELMRSLSQPLINIVVLHRKYHDELSFFHLLNGFLVALDYTNDPNVKKEQNQMLADLVVFLSKANDKTLLEALKIKLDWEGTSKLLQSVLMQIKADSSHFSLTVLAFDADNLNFLKNICLVRLKDEEKKASKYDAESDTILKQSLSSIFRPPILTIINTYRNESKAIEEAIQKYNATHS